MNKFLFYAFCLALVLVLVAYYKGANTLLGTGFTGASGLIAWLTGRNPQTGQFANYPQ